MTRITSIRFQNFRCLRDCELPLGKMTLLIGPNGSGKSTVFFAIAAMRQWASGSHSHSQLRHVADPDSPVTVSVAWDGAFHDSGYSWQAGKPPHNKSEDAGAWQWLQRSRLKRLSPDALRLPSPLGKELDEVGHFLPGVLDSLLSEHRERFDQLEAEFCSWLPEFDSILLEADGESRKRFALRTRDSHHRIPAANLSDGTLLALALLTLAWLPEPPSLLCIEEPDRGIHPRLLKDVQQALYRLSDPEVFGETNRQPVQVIATTHCPYLLDLFRDTPEQVVVASKNGLDVSFKRLVDIDHYQDLVRDSHLGEAWYSGVLGGVPQ